MAFSFYNKLNGESLRMIIKPLNQEMDRQQRQEYILNSPVDQLFDFSKPRFELPEKARIFTTVACELCGEGAPEHKMRINDGKKVCLDCFKDYSRGW